MSSPIHYSKSARPLDFQVCPLFSCCFRVCVRELKMLKVSRDAVTCEGSRHGLATTRTHMFELLVRNLPAQAALFALGMPSSVVAMSLLIYAACALHGHSNLRVGGRWLEMVFVTPRLHHLHHMPATTQSNFGTVFTLWDRIFGRLVFDANPHERTGVPGEIDEYPQRFLPAFRQPMMEASGRHVPTPSGVRGADRLPTSGSNAA